MQAPQFVRARAGAAPAALAKLSPGPMIDRVDLSVIAQHMFALMLRNVASDGYPFADPYSAGQFSRPGCVIAAPSYPSETPGVDQDYVFNWVRDGAITAMELAAAKVPPRPGAGVQPLIDYVTFAQVCQGNATPTMGHACFTIEGQSRPWSEQDDGPAIQTLAMLQAFDQLDTATQAIAIDVMTRNVDYLVGGVYQDPTTNLWEEHQGLSFFARAVQLRCFREISSNTHGINVPGDVADAITWLENALAAHWNEQQGYYVTMLAPPAPGAATSPTVPFEQGYDPNIDIVSAAVYGAIPYTDTKLLATAAKLRYQWADGASRARYGINLADATVDLGPLMGRYPGDTYDGDSADHQVGGHPWALCTCNFAQLYYGLANEIAESQKVPFDDHSQQFFAQVGIDSGTPAATAVNSLQTAGDAMLRAVVYHGDNLELSEQYDGSSGYEKSVRNLTWSYASFLSAVREKTGKGAKG
jgi:glucoamylase